MSSPARSDAVIDSTLTRAGCSADGAAWVKCALNPYSDQAERLVGYPDDCMADSVPQIIRQSIQIAAPQSITGSALWDCHIVQLPWRNAFPTVQLAPAVPVNVGSRTSQVFPDVNTFSVSTTGINATCGGLTIMAGPAGTAFSLYSVNNWSPTLGFTPSVTNYQAYLALSDVFTSGICRVVGSGWEVHNTTSDLNKQGTVTVYRQPIPNQTMVSTVNACASGNTIGLFNNYSATALYTPHPPVTLADAMLYPNTKQWEAKDGVYAVDMIHDTDIKPQGPLFTVPVIVGSNSATPGVYTFQTAYPAIDNSINNAGQPIGQPDVFWTQMEQTGAWFTGLSASTTLTINLVTIIERFPTIGDDPNLLVVASPSCKEDRLALRVYADTVRLLPIAVPVAQNGFGDWIKNAASTVYKVVAPMIRMSGNPHMIAALTGGEAIYNLGKKLAGR